MLEKETTFLASMSEHFHSLWDGNPRIELVKTQYFNFSKHVHISKSAFPQK